MASAFIRDYQERGRKVATLVWRNFRRGGQYQYDLSLHEWLDCRVYWLVYFDGKTTRTRIKICWDEKRVVSMFDGVSETLRGREIDIIEARMRGYI